MLMRLSGMLVMTKRYMRTLLLAPFLMIRVKARRAVRPTTYIAAFFSAARRKMMEIIKLVPEERKDYVEFKHRYVAKTVLIAILVLLIAVPILFYVYVRPVIESRYLVKTLYTGDKVLSTYTGRTLVLESGTEAPYFEGRLEKGKKVGKGTLWQKNGNKLYEGEFKDDKYDGMGILYYENGIKCYEGDFVKGKKTGTGILWREDGSMLYQGDFLDDNYHDKGTLYDEKGNISYKGEFVTGVKTGKGIHYGANGQKIYEGSFKEDSYDGEGILYDADEKIVYKGKFKEGKKSGKGTLYQPDGTVVYEGEFDDDKYNGSGVMYENGLKIYEGSFKQGKKYGEGKLYDEKGNVLYEGLFNGEVQEGEGAQYYEDGKLKYKGSIERGMYNGKGILFDPSGSIIYEGEFLNGLYHGNGKLNTQKDLDWYEGEFSEGKYSGTGKLYREGVLFYEGEFRAGSMNGMGKLYGNGSTVLYEGGFRNNEIDYGGILSSGLKEVSKMLQAKTSTVILNDGFVLGNSELCMAVFFNFVELDTDSLAKKIYLWGERSIGNEQPLAGMGTSTFGKPIESGSGEIDVELIRFSGINAKPNMAFKTYKRDGYLIKCWVNGNNRVVLAEIQEAK